MQQLMQQVFARIEMPKVRPNVLASRRKDIIELELKAHGIGSRDPYGQFEPLVSHLYEAMMAPPHENRLASTGIILLSEPFDQYRANNRELKDFKYFPVRRSDVKAARAFADGTNSFFVRGPEETGLLVPPKPIADELDLFTLRDDTLADDDHHDTVRHPLRECLIIQRIGTNATQRLTVLCRERIVTFAGLTYSTRPYQYDVLDSLAQQIRSFPWDQTPQTIQTIKSALRLAVHLLSPSGIGATLVLLAPEDDEKVDGLVANGELIVDGTLRPPTLITETSKDLVITKRLFQRPLVHLMSQRDGATTVTADGQVLHIGAFFKTVSASQQKERNGHPMGTRHRSAMEFSRLIGGLVIVVSSDGPVTIFKGGDKVATSAGKTL